MPKALIRAALLLAAAVTSPAAQAPEALILRLDPALDAIVSPDAKLEVLKDGFGLIEAPVWRQEGKGGHLLFSDMAANVIYKWTPEGGVSVFLEQAGFTGTDTSTLFPGRVGPNGMALDREGNLIICQHGDRALTRLNKDGSRTVLVDRYEGKRINGPNDVAMKSDGALYFTDRGSGLRGPEVRELPYRGIFRYKDGKLDLLARDDAAGAIANGIAFSPDERHLYLTDEGRIKRFEVKADGTIANGEVFIDLRSPGSRGTTDGMKVDRKGNVYATGPGGVWIIAPSGKHLGTIRTPGNTNVGFGDPDGKSLYVTGGKGLYRIRLNASGV